jgi:hypothetical protein
MGWYLYRHVSIGANSYFRFTGLVRQWLIPAAIVVE